MSESSMVVLKNQLERASVIVPAEYGRHLHRVLHERMMLSKHILNGDFDSKNFDYAIEEFQQYNKIIERILGL